MNYQQEVQKWLDYQNLSPELRSQLHNMPEAEKQVAFGYPLEFGTAGMRGLLGPGIGEMNIYTVKQASEGLSRFILDQGVKAQQQGVVISYDSRYHSREFAEKAAAVLGYHQIKTYVFDDIRPTPELSYAVRALHTFAGIMVTASHNPKRYNGYKVYGSDGAQISPEEAAIITKYIRQVANLFQIKEAAIPTLRADKLLEIVGYEIDEAYLNQVKSVNISPKLIEKWAPKTKIVYTPLYGTGKVIGYKALKNEGFTDFYMVESQAIADPEFPQTPRPNPEYEETFAAAKEIGEQVDADILIASDPDADRLGVEVKFPDGAYHQLTGNQIAAIILNYLLNAKKERRELPKDGAIVASIVSSLLPQKIAADFGVKSYQVETGFKFIGEKIEEFAQQHQGTFLFGFEESYGFLLKPFVRDKDAIQAITIMAEIAAYYKSQNQTIYDGLQDIFAKYGYFLEKTQAQEFSGVAGKEKMTSIMQKLRDAKISEFAHIPVTFIEDYAQNSRKEITSGQVKPLNLPRANVLRYLLSDDSWIAVRPSGTEPKIKYYFGTQAATKTAAKQKLAALISALKEYTE